MDDVQRWREEVQDTRHWYPGKPKTRDERILDYITQLEKTVQQLSSERSWRDNPDRMGGQFTQQEIEDAERGGPPGWY